ncbi:MAG: hypothetical protein ABIW48_09130 [Burkholderiales bacterium]
MPEPQALPITQDSSTLLRITHVIYGLLGLGLLLGWFPAVIGVILNYVKLESVKGTWLESHFRWQIRTFWWGLLWAVIGIITYLIVVGWIILIADGIWILYRVIKGWLNLNEKKPMPGASTPFPT